MKVCAIPWIQSSRCSSVQLWQGLTREMPEHQSLEMQLEACKSELAEQAADMEAAVEYATSLAHKAQGLTSQTESSLPQVTGVCCAAGAQQACLAIYALFCYPRMCLTHLSAVSNLHCLERNAAADAMRMMQCADAITMMRCSALLPGMKYLAGCLA